MRNICRYLLLLTILASVLSITAFASSYDNISKELTSMGLYSDSSADFSSSAVPSRADAAAVLVRLLGEKSSAEAQYSTGKISCPFKDVTASDAPYVAWLYANKIVGGKADASFGASEPCNVQTFCTFALRALGYSEGTDGDFRYKDADDFAAKVGIFSPFLDYGEGKFTWFQMTAIAYQTLMSSPKGSSVSMLEKLISDGTVKPDDAKLTLGKLNAYSEYQKADKALEGVKNIDLSLEFSLKESSSSKMNNDSIYFKISSLKLILDQKNPQMELIGTMQMDGETFNISSWVRDGYIYKDISGNIDGMTVEQKSKKKLESDSLSRILTAGGSSEICSPFAFCPLYLIDSMSFSKNASGADCSATVPFENFYDIISQGYGMAIPDISGNINFNVHLGTNGILSSINAAVNAKDSKAALSGFINVQIIKTGDSVTITYPNFSSYPDYSSLTA